MRTLIRAVSRHRGMSLRLFLLVLAAGVLSAAREKPVYEAHAVILIMDPRLATNPLAALMSPCRPYEVDIHTELLQSGPFLREASQVAGVRWSVPEVSVRPYEDLPAIRIDVRSTDRHEAARLANVIAELHLEHSGLPSAGGLRLPMSFFREEYRKAGVAVDRARLVYQREEDLLPGGRTSASSHRISLALRELNQAHATYEALGVVVRDREARLAAQLKERMLERARVPGLLDAPHTRLHLVTTFLVALVWAVGMAVARERYGRLTPGPSPRLRDGS